MTSPLTPQHPELISEAELQATVVGLARTHGWMVYGVIDRKDFAKRYDKGFPDLVLVKGDYLVFAELKSENGELASEQWAWLNALEVALGANQYHGAVVWRPSDLPLIEDFLTGG